MSQCEGNGKDDRVRRIKEERRKAHEERIEQLNKKISDKDESISRFNKYRRSGRGQGSSSNGKSEEACSANSCDFGVRENIRIPQLDLRKLGQSLTDDDMRYEVENIGPFQKPHQNGIVQHDIEATEEVNNRIVNDLTHHENSISAESSCSASINFKEEVEPVSVLCTTAVAHSGGCSGGSEEGAEGDKQCVISSNSEKSVNSSSSQSSAFLGGSHQDRVLRRPIIPTILKSAGEGSVSSATEECLAKKPSILKKKDDTQNNTHSNSPLATVSFGLSASTSVLTRTKSTDSNLSAETETGYWSGGESVSGILKSSSCSRDNSFKDQRSILKHRRSSLGSSAITCSEGGLHSILKRKLSHDSSLIMRDWYSSENSLSTGSLTQCGSPSPEPKPILKKKSSSEDFEESEPKPILKYRNSREFSESSSAALNLDGEKIKPCLKKFISKSTDDGVTMNSTNVNNFNISSANGRGILKKTGILKRHANDSSFSSASESECFRSVDFDSRQFDSFGAMKDIDGGEANGQKRHTSNRLTSHGVETGYVNVLRQKGDSSELSGSSCGGGVGVGSRCNFSKRSTSMSCSDEHTATNALFGDCKRNIFTKSVKDTSEFVSDSASEDLAKRLYNLNSVKDNLLKSTVEQFKMEEAVKRTESQEDIIMNLSVAEKRSLFMQMERERQLNSTNKKNGSTGAATRAKRFTQPVTTDEVEKATKLVVVNREIDYADDCATQGDNNKGSVYSGLKTKSDKEDGVNDGAIESSQMLNNSSTAQVSHLLNRKFNLEKNTNTTINGGGSGVARGSKFSAGLSFDSAKDLTTFTKATLNPVEVKKYLRPTPNANTEKIKDDIILERAEDPSKMSLRDRVRMFNNFSVSSESSTNFLRPIKKTVTSKRFNTQPVTPNDHRRIITYELSPTRVNAVVVEEGACTTTCAQSASTTTAFDKTYTTTTTSNTTTTTSKSTVRDEEGQECESECGKGDASGDAHLVAEQLLSSNSTSDVESNTSPSSSPTSSSKMPEKVSSPEDYNNIRESVDIMDSSDRKSDMKKSNNRMPNCAIAEQDINSYQVKQKVNNNKNSIADKIAALQTNGELGWKKRIAKLEPEKETSAAIDQNDNDSSVVASRLSLLETAQESWKKRVLETDATNFTVQGKLEKAGKFNKESSPVGDKKVKAIKTITPLRFKSKDRKLLFRQDDSSSQEEIFNEENKLQRRLSMPLSLISRSETSSSSDSNAEEEKVIRNVAKNDNETFTQFFSSVNKAIESSHVQVDESSFIAIQTEQRQLLGTRRNIKAHRNHGNVKNPIKALASRINLSDQSYVEINPEIREREMKKRVQIDNLAKNSHLSIEALAGLASKEDFTAVKLKKAQLESNKEYPHPMLIRVKGKRQVQSRMVSPEIKSLNSGDNYILVLPDKIYHYVGEFSNRMERSKSADLVAHISQKKDLGCRISSLKQIVTLEEPRGPSTEWDKFFNILGGSATKIRDDGLGDDLDEAYEVGVVATNRIYAVDVEKLELVPVLQDGYWVTVPKYSLLKDDKVFVFDFGSELYVWSGSKTDTPVKKLGFHLAKELYQSAYSYSEVESECSPVEPRQGKHRPKWCWLKKINQKMEPIIFIEKFFDWPDDSGRMIKVNQVRSRDSLCKEAGFNFQACDINEMLSALENVEEPSLDLEGFDVHRGTQIYDEEERRTYTISTVEVQSWHVSEFSTTEVEAKSVGHFFADETYVIRWQYSISQIGRDLKGNTSRHAATLGRERCAYFFWHGRNSKVTEQGTSALMTVELDKEKGPQVRVEHGHEPPAFLSLFKGLMFIHLGQSSKIDAVNEGCRLYVVLGCLEEEGHLIEVPCEANSFRSKGSFLIIDQIKSKVYTWHGCLANEITKKIAENAATYVQKHSEHWAVTGNLKYTDIEEGDETLTFLSCFNITNAMIFRESYVSLMGRSPTDSSKIQIFAFSSITGAFEASPVFSSKRKRGQEETFPVLQEDIYSVQQPCLFLLSNGEDTFLWQGWRPRDEENENTSTGSGEFRWAAERKVALETAIEYCKVTDTHGHLVHAGLEPPVFKNLFPYWSVQKEVCEISTAEGKTEEDVVSLELELKKFLKTDYTLEELQDRPEGVDLSKLETYLSDDDFENLLKMSREDFSKLQAWKKTELKKQAGLF